MPEGVGWSLGDAFPSHLSACRDLTTIAPRSSKFMYSHNSLPYPAVPEAVITGFGKLTDPYNLSLGQRLFQVRMINFLSFLILILQDGIPEVI